MKLIPWGFGFFYFSANQKVARISVGKRNRNFCKPILQEPVEYTEWVSRFPFLPGGRWSDCKLVGIGFFHHTEN